MIIERLYRTAPVRRPLLFHFGPVQYKHRCFSAMGGVEYYTMKILIIDDSNAARFLAVKMVREIGYKHIVDVDSAEEALLKIKTMDFDCILLDWNLGGMSGFDFLREFRSDPGHNKTAVIMVTTVNERSSVLKALKVGVQGYFFKPINAATLGPKLKEIEASLAGLAGITGSAPDKPKADTTPIPQVPSSLKSEPEVSVPVSGTAEQAAKPS
jgi:two-component system, chemotaxis family, chemotaxis protein CheY